MPITIVLADDHKLIRECIGSAISARSSLKVIGETESGNTVVEMCAREHPDIAILDISMEGLNGIDSTKKITAKAPQTKVIILSMHSDKTHIIKAFEAGARGYLLKSCALEELIDAINTVFDNKRFISPSISNILLEDFIASLNTKNKFCWSILTQKEREVLQLIAGGKSTKEISLRIGACIKTVETHRQNIMNKLDLHSVAELTKYAVREGLTQLD